MDGGAVGHNIEPLNQIKPNLAGMVPGWVPFKILSDSPALHARWLLLLKLEISSIVHCCFSTSICLICIIGINRLKEKFHTKKTDYMLNSSLSYLHVAAVKI
jgi:hypothetical protein